MRYEDVGFIRAKLKDDYVFDGIKSCGFEINIPYKDYNLFLRLLREIWFRLHLPFKKIWYNSKAYKNNKKVYVIIDPLMIPDYINLVHETNPKARIILMYENRADSTIDPRSVSGMIEKWSYDQDDCNKYNMNLFHPCFFEEYKVEKDINECDILYLGRDKGRLDYLLELQKEFQEKGLTTCFHICADRSYMRFKNSNYKKEIPYKMYLNLMKKTKAILNVARKDQVCITQRELEGAFCEVKCITTNSGILDFELYDPSRYYLLTADNGDGVVNFLNTEYKKIDESVLNEYKYKKVIWDILNGT